MKKTTIETSAADTTRKVGWPGRPTLHHHIRAVWILAKVPKSKVGGIARLLLLVGAGLIGIGCAFAFWAVVSWLEAIQPGLTVAVFAGGGAALLTVYGAYGLACAVVSVWREIREAAEREAGR